MRQSCIWPILCQLMTILPVIYINNDIQTNFEVNQTQIGHYVPKNTPKITKMAIPQNSDGSTPSEPDWSQTG